MTIDLPDPGAACGYTVALWIVRVETDGRGGLVETPVRPLPRADSPSPELGPAARRQARVLELVARHGELTTIEIIHQLHLSRSMVKSAIRSLRDRGLLRMVGSGRDASYVVARPDRPAGSV